MAEEMKNLSSAEEVAAETVAVKEAAPVAKKEKKAKDGKGNFFVRLWNGIKKLCRDTVNEMKKVRWTPKNELIKSSVLVVVAVCATALALGLIDLVFSLIIDGIAFLIG